MQASACRVFVCVCVMALTKLCSVWFGLWSHFSIQKQDGEDQVGSRLLSQRLLKHCFWSNKAGSPEMETVSLLPCFFFKPLQDDQTENNSARMAWICTVWSELCLFGQCRPVIIMSFKDGIPTQPEHQLSPLWSLGVKKPQHPAILCCLLPHTFNTSGQRFGLPFDFKASFCSLVVFSLVFITHCNSSNSNL